MISLPFVQGNKSAFDLPGGRTVEQPEVRGGFRVKGLGEGVCCCLGFVCLVWGLGYSSRPPLRIL